MRLLLALALLIALAAPSRAQVATSPVPASTPPELEAWLLDTGLLVDHTIDTTINPFYLRADINGDGKADYVVSLVPTVRDRSLPVELRLVAVLAPKSKKAKARIAEFPHADMPARDGWYVVARKTKVGVGATGGKPPRLKGDAVMLWKAESSSAIVYWTGKKLATYWQAD